MATDNLEETTSESELLLTTKDNPYNPHVDYDKWRRWDEAQGYFTESYLARMVDLPEDVDDEDNILIDLLTSLAIQEILDNDDANLYMLV